MKRVGLFLALVILMASIVAGVIYKDKLFAAAGDLTEFSPTESSMIVNPPGDTDATRHILITSDHGDAHTIKLGLYYNDTASGSRTFRILGGDSTRCGYTRNHGGAGGPIGNNRNVVRVRFVIPGDSEPYVYQYDQMCNLANNTTRTRDITIPARIINNAPVDDTTNNRYKRVTAIIEHVDGMKTAADANVDGTTTFQARAIGARVGLIDTAESENDPNNSFVSRRGYANTDRDVRLEIPFGLDCTQGSRQNGNAQVVVYDADNGPSTPRQLYFHVQRNNAAGNWVTLDRGQTGDTIHPRQDGAGNNTGNVSVDPAGRATPHFMGDGGNRAYVEISHMRANTKYRVVIRDLYMGNFNYIYVGMPGDSIFGTDAINCVHRASPTLTITPDVDDYIEVGGTFTATAGIQNLGTATAKLQYLHRIWYGTGNDGYNAAQGDSNLQETGWVDRNVGAGNQVNVNTYTWSNISPPANARYVCSSMNIRNQPFEETEIVNDPITKCTPIGKAPSFAVTAGGVRTGGNYGSGTCSVTKPGPIAGDANRLGSYFGITAHGYSSVDVTNPHHTYIRDSALSLGFIDNIVSKQAGIGNGANTELHFARGPGPVAPAATVRGGGLFYGEFDSAPSSMNTHCLTDLFKAGRYPAAAPTPLATNPTVTLPDSTAGVNAFTYNVCSAAANNVLTLNGPNAGDLVLDPGQQYVVRITSCNANPVYVRINADIRYQGTAAAINQLPQFVLLAGTDSTSQISIHVDNSVTRLDGIYAIRGTDDNAATFLTCAQRADPGNLQALRNIDSSATYCSNQLQVYGAVVLGGRLDPYRTYGHGDRNSPTFTAPAEIFNLRPDTVLSDYARSRAGAQLEVVNQRELAPRF